MEARKLWARLNLLDHQVIDRTDRMCGNVDDVELDLDADGRLVVTGIRVGGGALAHRLGSGRLGRWLERFHAAEPVPLARIAAITDHVRLSLEAEELPTFAGERWVQDHVIAHIPGGDHAAE